ncbi:MAG: fumarylacetoacetate hydrolase family protein [Phycisphaerae bacterium]|nr:fumarylacetoacetate hydrolase family protein [Phycisphaerae bacterium]
MKLCRIIDKQFGQTYAISQPDGSLRRCRVNSPFELETVEITGEAVCPEMFLPPIEPRSILCVAGNYRKHVEEFGTPPNPDIMVFMKNPASAIGHQQPIVIPSVCGDEVDYECELAMVISRPCRDVAVRDARNYILGFTIANDVSARIWQKERGGGQWCRGKGFDTFCPLGPFLITPDEVANPNDLRLTTTLNGRVVQDSRTSFMTGSVDDIVSFLSQGTTLLQGTVILTGTPEGVGWARTPKLLLQHGDTVTITIDALGELTNSVIRKTSL